MSVISDYVSLEGECMPIAVFQCDTSKTVAELETHLELCQLPVWELDFWTRGRLLILSFIGDCTYVYNFCMSLVPNYGHRVVFVGIDETKKTPRDEYRICTLDTMTIDGYHHTEQQQNDYRRLIDDFIPAIQGSRFSWAACLTIAERCVLGVDTNESVDFCTQITMMLSNMNHSRKYINDFFWNLSSSGWSTDRSFTFARVMAHWCYLRLPKFKK